MALTEKILIVDDDKAGRALLSIYLKEALSINDFTLAIRINYLMLLKELNVKKFIYWSKEKTNGEYLNELSSQKCYYDFKKITLAFEIAWYGERKVEKRDYEKVVSEFEKMKAMLNNG